MIGKQCVSIRFIHEVRVTVETQHDDVLTLTLFCSSLKLQRSLNKSSLVTLNALLLQHITYNVCVSSTLFDSALKY